MSFLEHVILIENKISKMAGYFSRILKKFKKRSKIKKLDYSEGHNFMCKKLGRSRSNMEILKPFHSLKSKNQI